MARVREWAERFLGRHRARFDPHDWPVDDTEEYREFFMLWITAFATREVTEAEADEASRMLAMTPPNFRREHLPMVVTTIETLRQQRGPRPGAMTREAVRDESRHCPYCCGNGLTTVWAEAPDRSRRIPETVAAYCVCSHGKFIKRAHADKSPDLLRGILDFGEVLDGLKRGWLPHPPGYPQWLATDPEPPRDPEDPGRAVTRAEIAEMFRPPF